jgi:hypothetical protein
MGRSAILSANVNDLPPVAQCRDPQIQRQMHQGADLPWAGAHQRVYSPALLQCTQNLRVRLASRPPLAAARRIWYRATNEA